MATSQNGWPVVAQSAVTDPVILGTEFPNGWLKGDVDTVFTYLIGRLHREVEPIIKGGCWGWYVKGIEGSSAVSNHASGTAIDYNAPTHPMGTRNTYGTADRVKIRKILTDLAGVVRWGGDYTGRPDDMHFEINANRAAVARVADWIREQQEDDVALTEPEWARLTKLIEANRAADPWAAAFGRDENRRTAGQLLVEARNWAGNAAAGVTELDVQADQYAAADAARDAQLPHLVAEALGAGQAPEQFAAALRAIPGVDWAAVGRALAAQ